jgi:hypothetical protein
MTAEPLARTFWSQSALDPYGNGIMNPLPEASA